MRPSTHAALVAVGSLPSTHVQPLSGSTGAALVRRGYAYRVTAGHYAPTAAGRAAAKDLPAPDKRGRYPAFAWPGGYPLLYLDRSGMTLCAKCASRDADSSPVIGAYVYWEGSPQTCEDCGAEIESAYGEVSDDA